MDSTSSNVIDGALAMIDVAHWGGRKLQVVCLMRRETLGHPSPSPVGTAMPSRYVAQWLGVKQPHARQLMRELVAERVLGRTDGAGSRAHAFRILNPARWRVPWAVPAELVAARLALLSRPPDANNARIVQRPSVAQGHLVQHHSVALEKPLATSQRCTSGSVVQRPNVAQGFAGEAADTIDLVEQPVRLSTDGRADLAAQVLGAVARRADGPVSGPFKTRILRALLGSNNVEAVVASVRGAAPGLRLPGLVLLVEQVCAAGPAPEVPPAARPPEFWTLDETPIDPAGAEKLRQMVGSLRSGARPCENGAGGAPCDG